MSVRKLHQGCNEMQLHSDIIHLIGYLGAIGSLAFGANQLRVILAKHSAEDVSVFDYVLRVVYSVLLGIYALGTSDIVFVVVNFGAAILSFAVAVASHRVQNQHNDSTARTTS
jgi:hypothetical protein